MSNYFSGVRNFEVGDYSNFSNVRGDQYNYNNCYNQITTGEGPQRKRLIVGNEEEETQYAEYHDVRRGDIVIRADLGTGAPRWRYDEDRREWVMVECECKFFTAVVRSDIGEVSTTIVSYQGLEKEEDLE
ncbi:hypothetical protein V5O48_003602 [Marasmius crinis-equi]|uniref:Uncharacterized protein n=1 Tax=Marasmius crinis-equi TaxID=585013 RepID=A0ABR3FSD8_9AGAR